MRAVGRLASGISMEQAQEEIDSAFAAVAEEHGKQQRGIRAEGLQAALVEQTRPLVLLLFGARLAGGCTSGHMISGISQLALSSFIFGVVTFGAAILMAKFLYRHREV